MPALEQSARFQKALLWPMVGYDRHGQPRRSSTFVELDVRWDTSKSEATDPQGNTVSIDATVVVDRRIAIGSEMWLGSVDDLEDLLLGPGTGTIEEEELVPTSDIMVVRTYKEVKDIRGRETRYEVGVARKTDTIGSEP